MSQRLLITNCRLLDEQESEKTVSVLIEDGIILRTGQTDICENILDADGRIVVPGFIDVHIQGAGGCDVLDGTKQALKTISQTCARFGTTGFLATTVFKPNQKNRHISIAAECVGEDLGGAQLLGIHLEGPFISPKKKGMIQNDSICEPSLKVLEEILEKTSGQLQMMTIAPELSGSTEIIKRLVDAGIIASFGHSSADYEQTVTGFETGINHITHLFNAMAPIHHRRAGPLVAIFENERITTQLISDGVHIHPSVIKLIFEILGTERLILITDGMRALGLPNGKYLYNTVEYESKDGTARYKDGTLIGTALSQNRLLKRFMRFTGCRLDIAIKTVTENPARLLNIYDRKGSVETGKDADLVLLDEDCSVHTTIVGGEIVFTSYPKTP